MRQPLRQPVIAFTQLNMYRQRMRRFNLFNRRQQPRTAWRMPDLLQLLNQLCRLHRFIVVPAELWAQPEIPVTAAGIMLPMVSEIAFNIVIAKTR